MLPRLLSTPRNRELLAALAWREVVVRYKRTALGLGWALVEPVALGLTYFVVFGTFARVQVADYPLFLLAGLFPWMFLQGTLNHCSDVMNEYVNILKKVYFPREVLVVGKVASQALNLGTGLVLVVAGGAAAGVVPWERLWLLVPAVALALVLAGTLGAAIAVVTPHLRDIPHIVNFALRLGIYATPVIYAPSMVPPGWRWALMVNPMTCVIELARAATLRSAVPDWELVAASSGSLVVCSAAAWWVFSALEERVTELL